MPMAEIDGRESGGMRMWANRANQNMKSTLERGAMSGAFDGSGFADGDDQRRVEATY